MYPAVRLFQVFQVTVYSDLAILQERYPGSDPFDVLGDMRREYDCLAFVHVQVKE